MIYREGQRVVVIATGEVTSIKRVSAYSVVLLNGSRVLMREIEPVFEPWREGRHVGINNRDACKIADAAILKMISQQ